MGEKRITMKMMLAVLLAAFLASEYAVVMVSGRYLPTRSQDDKLERLRELLKDLLESQSMNSNRPQETSYDMQGGPLSPSRIGTGIGSGGRAILFKRDIHEPNSGYLANPSGNEGRHLDGLESSDRI